jgi:hypothetical protein
MFASRLAPLLVCTTALMTPLVDAGPGQPMMTTDITVPGPQARAIAVAQAEFQKTAFAIENYQVIVTPHADAFEVTYLPAQPAGRSVRGGETPAGKEIHYWVSRQDFSLLRTSFAR